MPNNTASFRASMSIESLRLAISEAVHPVRGRVKNWPRVFSLMDDIHEPKSTDANITQIIRDLAKHGVTLTFNATAELQENQR